MERGPAAVVVGVGGAAGVSAIRALGRRGVRVYAVDHLRSPLGFHSRYAAPRRVPDPQRDEQAFVAALVQLADELGEGAPIFPARDEDLNAVARNHDVLGHRFRYPFPGWNTLGPIQEKAYQVKRATELGLSVPLTAAGSAGVDRFPVLVKPSRPAGFRHRFGVQAIRCETRTELESALEAARPFEPLVQEVIPGADRELFTLGAYLSEDGRPVGVFGGRKLRQTPRRVGTCRIGEAVWVEEVVEQGLRLLRGLDFTGIAQVEFTYDRRDGAFKFIEVNPRLWQWHENAASCGVDVAWLAYRDLIGETVAPTDSRGCRKRWALTFYDSLVPALARPPDLDPLLARDDSRLAIAHLARVARASLQRQRPSPS